MQFNVAHMRSSFQTRNGVPHTRPMRISSVCRQRERRRYNIKAQIAHTLPATLGSMHDGEHELAHNEYLLHGSASGGSKDARRRKLLCSGVTILAAGAALLCWSRIPSEGRGITTVSIEPAQACSNGFPQNFVWGLAPQPIRLRVVQTQPADSHRSGTSSKTPQARSTTATRATRHATTYTCIVKMYA